MTKIALVGGSYEERSLPFDAQRSINLYAVQDQEGSEVAALYGTPGLSLFGTVGLGNQRQAFASDNGRVFCVSGAQVFEVFIDGTSNLLGAVSTSSGRITMAENGVQLAIADGALLYMFTYSTDTFEQVTAPGLPASVGTVTFANSYFVVNENNTGRFFISGVFDGLSWNALDFATAESAPDNLQRPIAAAGQLWLIGDNTIEPWQNTGASSFPFQRYSGVSIDKGTASPYSVLEVDDTLYWIGQDKQGGGVVYRASGFSPERISNHAIEIALQKATNLRDIQSWSYQQDGHLFYAITGGGLETTLVLDITTNLWHERAYLNDLGRFEQHLGNYSLYAFGKHLVGDRRNGNIYEMSQDFYDDNGDEIVAERTYTHLVDELDRLVYNRLEIFLESGVGTQTGQGSDPKIVLNISKDGARTWSDDYEASIGKAGNFQTKVVFRRLGLAEIMTFRVRITDPVKRSLIGSYIR
jgi:hypothetical protein